MEIVRNKLMGSRYDFHDYENYSMGTESDSDVE